MTITPDFKDVAYRINRVLNGLQHDWCDGHAPDVRHFAKDVEMLRHAHLVDYLEESNPPLGRALYNAFWDVDAG
jgi:hypothetical protein